MKSAPVFHPARQTIFAVLASSPKASEPFRAWLAGMFDTRFGSAKALLDSVIPALRQAHSTDTAVDLLRGAVAEGWVTRCPNEDRGTILGAMRRGGYAVQPELCYGYEPVLASAEARLFLGGQYLWTPIAGNHASRQPSAALCACGHPLSRHAGRDDHSLVCYEHPCRCEAFAGQEMPDATTISRTIEATHAKPERTLPRILTPYYQRGSVTLYCGDAREIVPAFRRRGIVLCDPPYSATVHENAVSAGRRRTPLLDGNGRVSPCAVARKVDLGFGALTPEFRRFCAEQAARLARAVQQLDRRLQGSEHAARCVGSFVGALQGNGDDLRLALAGSVGQQRHFAHAGRTVAAPEIDHGDPLGQVGQADEGASVGEFEIERRAARLGSVGRRRQAKRPRQQGEANEQRGGAVNGHRVNFTPP